MPPGYIKLVIFPAIAGENDTPEEAQKLGRLLQGLNCHVNIIPLNPVDVLPYERPDPVDCPLATWGPEWGRLEIQTGACNYLFLRQPSLAPIDRGDALEVVVFHDALDAAEPAQGHVALLIEDEVVWEQTVDIPAEAEVLQEQIPIDESWPEGAAIGLHLHNHGYNAWTLAELTVIPRGGR